MRPILVLTTLALATIVTADTFPISHVLQLSETMACPLVDVTGGQAKYTEWGPGKLTYDDLHVTFLKGSNQSLMQVVAQALNDPSRSFKTASVTKTASGIRIEMEDLQARRITFPAWDINDGEEKPVAVDWSFSSRRAPINLNTVSYPRSKPASCSCRMRINDLEVKLQSLGLLSMTVGEGGDLDGDGAPDQMLLCDGLEATIPWNESVQFYEWLQHELAGVGNDLKVEVEYTTTPKKGSPEAPFVTLLTTFLRVRSVDYSDIFLGGSDAPAVRVVLKAGPQLNIKASRVNIN